MKYDHEFWALLKKIKEDHHLDLTEYNLSTIQRRIRRRLFVTRSASYLDYARVLDQDSGEYQRLIEEVTIKVSWFFRDPAVFEILGNLIWPKILEQKVKRGDSWLRIWSAGCAGGEEAYSVAILLAECLKDKYLAWDINIFASDLDRRSLTRGQKGIYSEDAVLEVKKKYWDRYFSPLPEQTVGSNSPACKASLVKVGDQLRQWVIFVYYDLLTESSISPGESIITDFDLILCRNVLMYFSRSAQKRILAKFAAGLEQGGYLILGKNEWMSDDLAYQWREIKEGFRIYQRQ